MTKYLLIFLGSGFGGLLRYSLSGWVQRLGNGSFPWGTLAVNLTGCFAIGFLSATFSGRILIREEYRIGFIVGILGGFTTFSAFGMETFDLLNDGLHVRAMLNIVFSVGVGLVAVWLGYQLARNLLGA